MERIYTWLRGRRRTILLTIFLLGLLPWTASAQFQFLYFQVDSLSDEPDKAPGDGVCSTLMGTCTLRAAVQEADVNGGSIGIPPGLVVLLNGDLDITKNMTIAGSGSAKPASMLPTRTIGCLRLAPPPMSRSAG